LKFVSRHRLKAATVGLLALAAGILVIVFWQQNKGPQPQTNAPRQQSTNDQEQVDEKIDGILDGVAKDLEAANAINDECRKDEAAYKEEGKKWTLAMVEAAESRVRKALDLHEGVEQRLKELEKYGHLKFDGESLQDFVLENRAKIAKMKAADQGRARYWEEEAAKRMLDAYIKALKDMNTLTDACILLQVSYEKEGDKWDIGKIEAAEKKVQELLDLQDEIIKRLKDLKQQYGGVSFDGQSLREYAVKHEEGIAKKKASALERKKFWEKEKEKKLKK